MEVEGCPLSVERAKQGYLSGELGILLSGVLVFGAPGGWPGCKGHLAVPFPRAPRVSLTTRCPFHHPEP